MDFPETLNMERFTHAAQRGLSTHGERSNVNKVRRIKYKVNYKVLYFSFSISTYFPYELLWFIREEFIQAIM